MRVEIYGSLLNSKEREKALSGKGIMIELGKEERIGWKLSFDKYSKTWNEAVLNFVYTGNQSDVYYTSIYEVDDCAYCRIMDREMGKITSNKWKHYEQIKDDSYRPKQLDSRFGKTDIFIIPEEGRKLTETCGEAKYVKVVRAGIKENYKNMPTMMEANLNVLKRAIEESKSKK